MAFTQITRAQFRAQLLERLGPAGSTFWRTDELNAYINECLRTWNMLTGYWRGKVNVTPTGTVANQVWYTLPAPMTSGMRVMFNGKQLNVASLDQLDNGRPQWESETTTDGGDVPSVVDSWAPAGLTLIAIWPADAAGTNSLLCDGILTTPIPANDAAFIDIGEEDMDTLLDYCEHLCQFKEGGQEFAASVETLYKPFLQSAATRNAMLMASAEFRKWMGLHMDEDSHLRQRGHRIGAR